MAAATGIAGNFVFTKIWQQNKGNAVREGILFNTLTGFITGFIFYAVSGFKLEYTPFSLLISALIMLCVGGYTLIGFRIMSMGNMTVYTVFLMLGGAVVPYIYGWVFLNEVINLPKILGLIFVVIAVTLNAGEEKSQKPSSKFFLLCIAVFLINGATSVLSKVHQIESVCPKVSDMSFVVLSNLVRGMMFLIMMPFCHQETKQKAASGCDGRVYLAVFFSSLVNGISYFLQLGSVSRLPATIFFPLLTCVSIAMTAVFDRLVFKETLSRKTWISMGICAVSLILFVV